MKKYLASILAVAAVLFVNLYLRAFPVNFPQLEKQAHVMVSDGVRRQAQQVVYQKFPQYDPLANERLVNEEVSNYKKYNRKEYLVQVDQLYRNLKDRYQDSQGQTYLMELDCWHWGQYVRNVLNHGHPGDVVREGRQVDSRMLAPHGDFLPFSQFNFYFPAFLYKLWSVFTYVPLFTFLFYLPLFYTALLIIIMYLFAYRHAGLAAGVVASLFVGLSSTFLPRSTAGWFDMDVLNIILPVAAMWAYLRVQEATGARNKYIWLGVCAFCIGLFCFTWANWWFIFFILIMYEGLFIISRSIAILRRKDAPAAAGVLRAHAVSAACFIGMSFVWIMIFSRLEPFVIWWNQIREALVLNKPLLPTIWPNVLSTVGELRKISPMEIAQSLGGPVITFASVACMLWVVIRASLGREKDPFRRASAFILLLWFLSMLYATYRGVRFAMFLIVPLGIFLGWGLRDFVDYVGARFKAWQRLAAVYTLVICIGIVLVQRAYQVAGSIYPLMNDRWYDVLIALKEKTPPDTVVNSWWDFGDWFKVVSERPVIFDGQSQNKPQAFWMGKALLSHNEQEALGILRMLNNGGNDAFELINGHIGDPLQSVLLLEALVTMDEAGARGLVSGFLPPPLIDRLLLLLFETPPPAEFLVDYSLVYKITAISYLGNWNFAKVYMVQNYKRMEKERIIEHLAALGKDRSLMEKYYQELTLIPAREISNWLSNPVQYFSPVIRGTKEGDAVIFENGFVFKPKENTIRANDGKFPRSLFLKQGADITEIAYQTPGLVFSVLVWENEQGYWAVLLDPTLGRSLFTKLYFLDGLASAHFQPHIRAYDGGNFIGTYQISW